MGKKLEYDLINGKVELGFKMINTRETYDQDTEILNFTKAIDYIDINKAKKWAKDNIVFCKRLDSTSFEFKSADEISGVGVTGEFILGLPVGWYCLMGMSVTSSLEGCFSRISAYDNDIYVMGLGSDYLTNGIVDDPFSIFLKNVIFFAEIDATIPIKYTDPTTSETTDLPSITVEEGKIYFFKTDDKNKNIVLDEVITVPIVEGGE